MTFDSVDALKSYILSRMQPAIQKAQEQVYQVIDRFVKEYYAEFSPEVDERTYQLYRSLVKSDIKSTGNGYEACVYFDIGALDYAMKTIGGVTVPNKGWSEEKTLTAAAHGSHGGYASGTAIWDEPIGILSSEAYNILKRMLIDAGIPLA